MKVDTFLTLALKEIRSARAGDVVGPDDMDDALAVFNELLDLWNVQGRALFSHTITSFTITPNLNPHTIGIAANAPTWSVSIARPSKIRMANLIIANNIRRPIAIRDEEWYLSRRAPAITSSIPTDLFYGDDWPNGNIYFYPVPLTAYSVQLDFDTLLAQVALVDTFSLPLGYQAALRLSAAEAFCGMWGQQVPASLAQRAKDARVAVFGNNDVIPNLTTRDAGMPSGRKSGNGAYDYRTGYGG